MQMRPQRRNARLVRAAAAALVAGIAGLLLPFAASPAMAAGPNAITLTLDGQKPFTVRAESEPDTFAALLNEVQWLASGPGRANGAEKGSLGPKVSMSVLVDDAPKLSFQLYPLAAGGPRACRPSKQPTGKKSGGDAWFLARLTLPDTLRAAGVALSGGAQPFNAGDAGGTGGSGGGSGTDDETGHNGPSFTRVADFGEVGGAWRQVLLLNGAVVLVIAAGLAGFSWLIRGKI